MKIIDNIIPRHYQDAIENVLTLDKDIMPWIYRGGTSDIELSKEELKEYNIFEQFQFTHQILGMGYEKDYHNPTYSHLFLLPIMEAYVRETGEVFNIKQLSRCKANLQTKSSQDKPDCYNFPHVDNEPNYKGLTAIYYVNDSDGDTYFFDENIDPHHPNIKEFLRSLKVVKKVSPKKGRMIIFDANIIHAGSHPMESDKRIAINYNIRL